MSVANSAVEAVLAAVALAAAASLVVALVCRAMAQRSLRESARRLAEAEAARLAAERTAAEAARLSRSVATIASGLYGSAEPERAMHRLATLLGTLVGADATVVLVADPSQPGFRAVDATGEAAAVLRDLRERVFALDVADVGVSRLSFSAGDSARLGAAMRERVGMAVGFAAPVHRGKQVAGFLLVAYRDATTALSDENRSLLATAAALAAVLFENLHLHAEFRASSEAKGEFIRTVSHELRTPLNAIIGYCDLLRDGAMGDVTDEQLETLDRLMRTSVEFAELIESVLEAERLERSPVLVEWVDCDLDAFHRRLEQSVPGYWRREGVDLRFVGGSPRTIRTDPDKLRLALRNVIHNALKFTPEGEVVVEMAVTPGTLMFTVRDTGCGIAHEIQQGLFQMFHAGDRVGRAAQGGLGLGLYLADRMVKALWGQIAVDSKPGQGTTVRIILPIEEPVAEGAVTA